MALSHLLPRVDMTLPLSPQQLGPPPSVGRSLFRISWTISHCISNPDLLERRGVVTGTLGLYFASAGHRSLRPSGAASIIFPDLRSQLHLAGKIRMWYFVRCFAARHITMAERCPAAGTSGMAGCASTACSFAGTCKMSSIALPLHLKHMIKKSPRLSFTGVARPLQAHTGHA